MRGKYNLYKFFMLVICCILIYATVYTVSLASKSNFHVRSLQQGWTIHYNGKQYYDQDIEAFQFLNVKKGDKLELSVRLPYNGRDSDVINLFCMYAQIEVKLDGQTIYQYKDKDYMNPGGYHTIHFVDNYGGENLTIRLIVSKSGAFSKIQAPIIGQEYDAYRYLFVSNFPFYMTCFMLIMFGLMFGCITAVCGIHYPKFFLLFHISLFSVMTGVWGLSSNSALQILINDAGLIRLTEYVSLYLCPVFILAMFELMFREDHKFARLLRFFFSIDVFYLVMALILQKLQVMHISQTLLPAYLLYLLEIFVCIPKILKKRMNKKETYKLPLIGMGIYFTTMCIDMYQYIEERYINANYAVFSGSVVPYGAFILVVCIILYYGNILMKNVYESNEKERLLGLAYHDGLTNLYNRVKYTEHLEMLVSKESKYCMISFDLNGLKETNDTRGHEYGDWLIIKFSNIIHQSFAQVALVARIGGDEFAAIIEDIEKDDLKDLLLNYEKVLKSSNEVSHEIYCSAAYGYAFSTETKSGLYQEVANLADARMYEMKQKQKEV